MSSLSCRYVTTKTTSTVSWPPSCLCLLILTRMTTPTPRHTSCCRLTSAASLCRRPTTTPTLSQSWTKCCVSYRFYAHTRISLLVTFLAILSRLNMLPLKFSSHLSEGLVNSYWDRNYFPVSFSLYLLLLLLLLIGVSCPQYRLLWQDFRGSVRKLFVQLQCLSSIRSQ